MADTLDREATDISRKFRHDRRVNDNNLKSRFEEIFQKYEKDFTGVGDEIDLLTGQIIVDNGHLQSMQHEVDPGEDSASAMVNTFAVDNGPESDDVMPEVEDDDSDEADDQVDDGFAGSLHNLSREIEKLSEGSVYSSSGILTDDETENDDARATHASTQPIVPSEVNNDPYASHASSALPPQIRILQNMPAALKESALAMRSTDAQFDKSLLDQLERNITGQIAQFLATSAAHEPNASTSRGPAARESAWSYPQLPVDRSSDSVSPQAVRPALPSSAALIRQSPRKKRSLWAPDRPAAKRSRGGRQYFASPPSRLLPGPAIASQHSNRGSSADADDLEDPLSLVADAPDTVLDHAPAYSANTARRIAPRADGTAAHHELPRKPASEPSTEAGWSNRVQYTQTADADPHEVAAGERLSDAQLDQSQLDESDFTHDSEDYEDYDEEKEGEEDSTTGMLYTKHEDELMVELRCRQGLSWREISLHLPGRNLESLLNRYTYIRRRILPDLIAKGEISADHLKPVYLSTKRALKHKNLRLSKSYRADALRTSLQQSFPRQSALSNSHNIDPLLVSSDMDQQVPSIEEQTSSHADTPPAPKEYVFGVADDWTIRRLRETEKKLFSEIAQRFPGTTEDVISDRYFNHIMGKTLPVPYNTSRKPPRKSQPGQQEVASQLLAEPHAPRSSWSGPASRVYTSVMPIRFTQWIPGQPPRPRRKKPRKATFTHVSDESSISAQDSARPGEGTSTELDTHSAISPKLPRPLIDHVDTVPSSFQDDDAWTDELQTQPYPVPDAATTAATNIRNDSSASRTKHYNAATGTASKPPRAIFPSSIPDTEDERLHSSNPVVPLAHALERSTQAMMPSDYAPLMVQDKTASTINTSQTDSQHRTSESHNISMISSQHGQQRPAYEHAERAETALQILRAVRESKGRLELQEQINALPAWISARYNHLGIQAWQGSPTTTISTGGDEQPSALLVESAASEAVSEVASEADSSHLERQQQSSLQPQTTETPISRERQLSSDSDTSRFDDRLCLQTGTPSVQLLKRPPKESVFLETSDDASATMSSLLSSGVLYGSLARVYHQLTPGAVKNRVIKMLNNTSTPETITASSAVGSTSDDTTHLQRITSAEAHTSPAPHDSLVPHDTEQHVIDWSPAAENAYPAVCSRTRHEIIQDDTFDIALNLCTFSATPGQSKQASVGSATSMSRQDHNSSDDSVSRKDHNTRAVSSSRQDDNIGSVVDKDQGEEICSQSSTARNVVATQNKSSQLVASEKTSSQSASASRRSKLYGGMSLAALEKAVIRVAQRKHAESSTKCKDVSSSSANKGQSASSKSKTGIGLSTERRPSLSVKSNDAASSSDNRRPSSSKRYDITSSSSDNKRSSSVQKHDTTASSSDKKRSLSCSSSSVTTHPVGKASNPMLQQRASSRKPAVVLGKSSRLSAGIEHRASTEAIRRMSSLVHELSDDELA